MLGLKACVFYFLSNFHFPPNDGGKKTKKNVFYFILKDLFVSRYSNFCIFVFPSFFPVSYCFRGWLKKNLKVYHAINCLNKNLITHFVWYLEKDINCDTEILPINRVLNMFIENIFLQKNHAENVHQKLIPDAFFILLNNPKQPLHARKSF